jgi:peptidoglycan/xylan/chitin deacetylase (PgdA/CDA1 family)
VNAASQAASRNAAPVRTLPAHAGECFLTFDDGPDSRWTPQVLESLEASGSKATFFVIGRLAQRHGELLRAARAAGHAIGNHGWSHRHPWTLSRAQARREVRAGADAVAQAVGVWPCWFRPPHGRLGRHLAELAREERQRIALWSLSAVDWGPLATAPRILDRLRRIGAGDIVLMHDGPLRHNRPDRMLQALPEVLADLTLRGLRPAPLPALATMAG